MQAALQGKPEIEPVSTCSSSGYQLPTQVLNVDSGSTIDADGSSGAIETSTVEMTSPVEIVTSHITETNKRKVVANEKVRFRPIKTYIHSQI